MFKVFKGGLDSLVAVYEATIAMRESDNSDLLRRILVMHSSDAVLYYWANVKICTAYNETIIVLCVWYNNLNKWARIPTKR